MSRTVVHEVRTEQKYLILCSGLSGVCTTVGTHGTAGRLPEESLRGGVVLCQNNLPKNFWWGRNGKQYLLVRNFVFWTVIPCFMLEITSSPVLKKQSIWTW
jgi:hypothetical protein